MTSVSAGFLFSLRENPNSFQDGPRPPHLLLFLGRAGQLHRWPEGPCLYLGAFALAVLAVRWLVPLMAM